MALPFSISVLGFKTILGPISIDNVIFYRLQGVFWTSLIHIFLYQYSFRSRNQDLGKFAIYLALFLLLNPYVLQTSQFFRYYSLYIAASVLITFFILQYDSFFQLKRRWFYVLLSVSFFIHLFITVQMITYIFFKELFLIDEKKKKLVFIMLGLILVLIVPKFPEILTSVWHTVFPVYAFDFPLVHRGFSISTIIKPFMTIFTFMFGRNLIPFSHIGLDICYIISGISIIYGTIILLKNKPMLRQPLLFSGIIPLIFSVFIIEPISLPMMTQLAPQHVIFLLPWLPYIFYHLWNTSVLGRGLNIIFFSGLLYGGYLQQKMEFVDWGKIQKTIKSKNTPIITDAPGTFDLFIENQDITWFGYNEVVHEKIKNNDSISVIMTNWKNYQIIDSLQFWHNPKGTKTEYGMLSEILLLIKNSGFTLKDSYSFFPIHTFTFVQDSSRIQKIPWFYDIKYRDLRVPLYFNNKKIIGFEKYNVGEKTYIDSIFYYFAQTKTPSDTNNVIEITFRDNTKKQYKLSQEGNTFRSYYCRSIENDSIIHSYKKMPLVSNSMKYPGSIFSSHGRIYEHKEVLRLGYTIESISNDVTLIKAIISEK